MQPHTDIILDLYLLQKTSECGPWLEGAADAMPSLMALDTLVSIACLKGLKPELSGMHPA